MPFYPVVTTSNGRVSGAVRDGAMVFRGLRYGAPAGGANRFLPPQPVQKWSGIIEAISPGPSAPQLPRPENTDPFFSWYSAIEPVSEDCLFLNVFTPGLTGKRPIMFWIHGGGWRECCGTAPGFDGSGLAASQDVVVVTINHRLGALGFLKLHGGDERFADSGNAGLLDIVAALEWVRDNAAAFGGDPDNVTLFGESGGASKVAVLMSMQRAKGLFHKAVVQSSGGVRLVAPNESEQMSYSLTRALGLDRADPITMQALPMEHILNATRSAPGPYRGIIDDRTLFEDPFGACGPETATDIPLLIGCTKTESTYYLRNDPKNFRLELPEVRGRLQRFLDVDVVMVDRIIRHYQSAAPNSDPSGLLIAITTDHIFKRHTYHIADRQAKSARASVYAYLFEWATPIEDGRMGSPHTVEVPFVFGTVAAAAGCVGTGADLDGLSNIMMSVWATFARTGDPKVAELPEWKPYEGDGQKMMILNIESRFERDPGAGARAALQPLPMFSNRNPIPAFAGG